MQCQECIVIIIIINILMIIISTMIIMIIIITIINTIFNHRAYDKIVGKPLQAKSGGEKATSSEALLQKRKSFLLFLKRHPQKSRKNTTFSPIYLERLTGLVEVENIEICSTIRGKYGQHNLFTVFRL